MPKPAAKKSSSPSGMTEYALKQLVASGMPIALRAHQDEGDYYQLDIEANGTTMRLLNAKGEYRTFSSLDSVANVVAKLGAKEFKTTVATTTARGR